MNPRSIKRLSLACMLLLAAALSHAETGYVTDVLSLGLHNAEDTSDKPFRYLKSGDPFEVLSRDRYYARVRLPDGVVGYVKINYVVFDKPARLIVAETAAERDRLAAELADLKVAFAGPAERLAALQQQADELETQLKESNDHAAELTASNAALAAAQARYKYSLPYTWVAGAILLCLVGGIMLGFWWVDRQVRRRHGGIRVL